MSYITQAYWENLCQSVKSNILHFGIPEMNIKCKKKSNNLIFAVIGYVNEIKGQDLFIDAINLLSTNRNIEFWLIGKISENGFGIKVREKIKGNSNIKIFGELNREEMEQAYSEIDVVVCPSRNEALSAVVVEGMMNEKICIVSEVGGIAPYIKNGENGFLCKAESVQDLASKMQWILDNEEDLEKIRKAARKTYEKNFTMDIFRDNLEKIVLKCDNRK